MSTPSARIVDQDDLKRALILNAIRPDIGGVLIRGERGHGQEHGGARAGGAAAGCCGWWPTAASAAIPTSRPPVRRVPRSGWPRASLPVAAERRTPFVDLPVSATEDRVVGTLDIERALATGQRHFEPGLLASANRGILYVDEVNLLDDHVVDVLLDAAAMGVNVVEREGVSFSHPARFILIGTMNPEEGELRPQLTDRFGLSVEVHGVASVAARTDVLRRRLAFDEDPEGFAEEWQPAEMALRDAIASARARLGDVRLSDQDLWVAAEIVSAAGVDGHRAELALLKAAQAHAAFMGRTTLTPEDLAIGARLALPHRLRRGPFESAAVDAGRIDELVASALHNAPPDEGGTDRDEQGGPSADGGTDGPMPRVRRTGRGRRRAAACPRTSAAETGGASQPVAGIEAFATRRLDATLDQLSRRATGRRTLTETATRRGRYIRARPVTDEATDIAVRRHAARGRLAPGATDRAGDADGAAGATCTRRCACAAPAT